MSFPDPLRLPSTTAEYAKVNDDAIADRISVGVSLVASSFGLPSRISTASASTVYLGLCHLRSRTLARQVDLGRTECSQALLALPKSGSISVNCAYFNWEDQKGKPDHLMAIRRAGGVYLPRIKSRKSICFALLMLGISFDLTQELPESDEWLNSFNFSTQ